MTLLSLGNMKTWDIVKYTINTGKINKTYLGKYFIAFQRILKRLCAIRRIARSPRFILARQLVLNRALLNKADSQ